jgi:hypothetical protein
MGRAAQLLEEELRRRGIEFAIGLDGRYEIPAGEGKLLLSLDNVARDLERDGDPGRIVRFLDAALASFDPLPPWQEGRARIYWSAEPSSSDFGDTIREPVTETVARVLVLASEDEGKITWLTPKCAATWSIGFDELRAAALSNLDRLLQSTRLQVESARGRKLGMIPVDSVLKASTIFAPSFKSYVASELGWPVLAVLPCRDFIYVIAEADQELLGAMGDVVQREFRESGYPITTEVLRISDEGLEAIGRFPE